MDLQPFFSRECSESAAEYPEDESLGELQTDYDVQNDETFGADFMPSDNDMEEFANMAADLAIEDEEAIQVPHSSQIPLPKMFSPRSHAHIPESERDSLSNIWSGSSFNGIGTLLDDYTKYQQNELTGLNLGNRNSIWEVEVGFPSLTGERLKNAKTLDQIEEDLCQSRKGMPRLEFLHDSLTNPNNIHPLPLSVDEIEKMIITTNATQAISAEELERSMMSQILSNSRTPDNLRMPPDMSNASFQSVHQMAHNATRVSPLLPHQTPPIPGMDGMPMIRTHGQMHPNQHIPPPQFPTINFANGNHIFPMPYGYPPTSHTSISHHQMQHPPPGSMPIPPPSMQHMPPIPGMACGLPFRHHYPIPIPSSTHHHSAPFHPVILQHPLNRHPHNVSNNHEVYTSRNNAVNAPPPHHNNSSKLSMLPSSLMYTPALLDSANRRRSRPAPLSNKTISDFALDPYAGFMSKKEQEWLIKIHLIQCTTTGDLTEDDYYYTMWKRIHGLNKPPPEWKMKTKGKYYSLDNTYPSGTYIPPSFSGALGKPIHCTTSNPRHMIDFSFESFDEDDTSLSNRQKKVKKMLMRIENGEFLLIDCHDLKRKLDFFEETQISNLIDKKEITSRTQKMSTNLMLLSTLFMTQNLLSVILLQKGRSLIYRILKFTTGTELAFTSAKALLENIQIIAKKFPEDEINPFFDSVFTALYNMDESQTSIIARSITFERDFISTSRFAQSALLVVLLAVAKNCSSFGTTSDFMCVKWLDFTGINFLPSLEGTVVPVESWAELLAKLSHFDTSKNMGIFATLLIKKIKAIVQ